MIEVREMEGRGRYGMREREKRGEIRVNRKKKANINRRVSSYESVCGNYIITQFNLQVRKNESKGEV